MNKLFKLLLVICIALFSMKSIATVDLLLYNGKVFTANPGQKLEQAIAVKDGHIVKVGSNAEVLLLKGARTSMVDLQGKVVMPGFIDSHSHPIAGGLSLVKADLHDRFLPVEELEQYLRGWRDDGKARYGDVLNVNGFPGTYWKQVGPLEQRFNQGEWASTPIAFIGSDAHTGWANKAMLKRAGIDAERVKSLQGEALATIGHHSDGSPNGFVAEAGLDAIKAKIPSPSPQELLEAGRTATNLYHSLGVTAIMDAAAARPNEGSPNDFRPTSKTVGNLPIYKELSEKGELNLRVAALIVAPSNAKPSDLDALDRLRSHFLGIKNLSLPGIKIFADGVPEFPTQTASLLTPYSNSNKSGQLQIDPAHFGELVSAIDARGWLVHVHAIGDRAVRESLNGIEQARRDRKSNVVHSITHLQIVNSSDFARFKSLNVIASMQLFWASADNSNFDLVKPFISPMQFHFMYPAHSLLKNGATIAGSSDWPVSTNNPWKAIGQAILRTGPRGVLNEDERLDRETMFYAYTRNGARLIGLENEIGSITAGKQADLIILDRDVFTVPDEQIADTQVLKTYFSGKEVYSRS